MAREAMLIYGLEIQAQTVIGTGLVIHHRGIGTVIHPETTIGDSVTIYHQVTIGRADAHVPRSLSPMQRIEISDYAILYPGCKILGGPGITRIGRGAIIGANAVVTRSVGDWEIWAGNPARLIGRRSSENLEGGS